MGMGCARLTGVRISSNECPEEDKECNGRCRSPDGSGDDQEYIGDTRGQDVTQCSAAVLPGAEEYKRRLG